LTLTLKHEIHLNLFINPSLALRILGNSALVSGFKGMSQLSIENTAMPNAQGGWMVCLFIKIELANGTVINTSCTAAKMLVA
jgi:hypothetical protein